MVDLTEQMRSLVRLRDEGLISEAEFSQRQAELLAQGGREAGSKPPIASIGLYDIFELAGEGGMGAVYRGRHRVDVIALRMGGDVAVKVLHAHLSRNQSLVQRFQQEAEALGRLDHPNIVRVHDVVRANETISIIMEWIPGRTLRDLLATETGPIPWERAQKIIFPVLDAVGHAHQRGIVHRDLKPDNIRISPTHTIKVVDFGIARLSDARTRTRTGTGMGTVDYMAPEQYANARAVDERADVYAIGMTLYEMVAGRLPWDPASVTEFETMQIKHRGDLEPPTSFYPDIPPWVVHAIEGALRPDPASRLPSIEALRMALESPGASAPGSTTNREVGSTPVVSGVEPEVDFASVELPPPEPREEEKKPAAAPNRAPLMASIAVAALVFLVMGLSLIRGSAAPPSGPSSIVMPSSDLMKFVAHDVLSAQKGITDTETRRKHYRAACEAHDVAACVLADQRRLPLSSWSGIDVSRLREACDDGQGLACLMAVRLLGTRGPTSLPGKDSPDAAAAAAMAERACDAGLVPACGELGRLVANVSALPGTEEEASGLLSSACDRGDLRACANLGVQFERGDGVPKDTATAIRLFGQACDGGIWRGCTYLGTAKAKGIGTRVSEVEGAALLEASCIAGEVLACLRLGTLLEDNKTIGVDHSLAANWYRLACDGGEGFGCSALGKLHEDGIGVPRDLTASRQYYRRACDDRVGLACEALGRLLGRGAGGPVDAVGAADALRQACTLGRTAACAGAGR